MITISFRDDFEKLERKLGGLAKGQLPFALSRALTDAARAAEKQVTAELPRIFDRPTPFTMRGVGSTAATKQNLTAVVFVKNAQAKYLLLEETGGTRTPVGKALVEPGALPLNQFGNIPNNTTKKLLAAYAKLQAARRSKRGAKEGVIYIRGGTPQAHGLPGGFFQIAAGHLTRLTGFVARAVYKPRFGFRHRVKSAARVQFAKSIWPRLAEALRSAR